MNKKTIIIASILFGMMLMPSILAYQRGLEWEATITIKTQTGKTDMLVIGEKFDASDGKDKYDMPKCPSPPNEFVSIWSNAGITIPPYQRLMKDYRLHGATEVWKIKTYLDSYERENMQLLWNRASFKYSGYNNVSLFHNGIFVSNMLRQTSYSFSLEPFVLSSFEIICS